MFERSAFGASGTSVGLSVLLCSDFHYSMKTCILFVISRFESEANYPAGGYSQFVFGPARRMQRTFKEAPAIC